MKLEEYEQLHPHARVGDLVFLTPNTHCAWRVDTLETKEPDTVEWIRRMPKGTVFYDVGANMGQYAMIAAQCGHTVHAFEPDSQNFALMCRNLALNKLKGEVTPWSIALTNVSRLDMFNVTSVMYGGSCNSFGDEVDYNLKPKKFKFRQGCYGMTMDDFAECYMPPTDIKIDVDGFEHLVLAGAHECLCHVRSVLVELNTGLPDHMAIFEQMDRYGLKADMETAYKARRKTGPFKGVGNVIFFRDGNDFLHVPEERWKPL